MKRTENTGWCQAAIWTTGIQRERRSALLYQARHSSEAFQRISGKRIQAFRASQKKALRISTEGLLPFSSATVHQRVPRKCPFRKGFCNERFSPDWLCQHLAPVERA